MAMASEDGEPQEAAGREEEEEEEEQEEMTPPPPPLPLLLLPAPPPPPSAAAASANAAASASSSLPPRILSLHKLSQSGKKPPGTWTPAETFHLINTYQEKWYALKRGQLRTIHWDEVAEKLASLCHGLQDVTPKSSMQCRHKLEKLRRRYRAERQLILRKGPAFAASGSWPFFVQMDHMERGPSAPPLQQVQQQDYQFHPDPRHGATHNAAAVAQENNAMNESTTISLDEDSDQPPPRVFATRKRRMHHHHQNPYVKEDHEADSTKKANKKKPVNGGSSSSSKREKSREASPVNPGPPPPNPPWYEMGHSDVQQASELAYLVRALGENFLRMEQLKIQMQRENELFRADMELRRTEMVIDSQKQIAELFSEAMINMKKKTKKTKKDQPSR